jgi:hypothetical protein
VLRDDRERHTRAVGRGGDQAADGLVGDGPDVAESNGGLGTSERCVNFVQCGTGVKSCRLLGVVDLASASCSACHPQRTRRGFESTHVDSPRNALHTHKPAICAREIGRRMTHADRMHPRTLSPRQFQDLPTLQNRLRREHTLRPALKGPGPVGECRQARSSGDRDGLNRRSQMLNRDLRQARHAAWSCARLKTFLIQVLADCCCYY